MSYEVSQQTQRLYGAYAVLGELVRDSIGRLDTDFHVLSAAKQLVHAEYLHSAELDRRRRVAAGSAPPGVPSIDHEEHQD
jgi:hypothetical protein